MNNKQLLIFDVDGTIVDSFDQLYQSAKEFIEQKTKEPFSVDDFRALLIGNPWENLMKNAGLEQQQSINSDATTRFYAPYSDNTVFPGMKSLIHELAKKNDLAIVTSTFIDKVTTLFEQEGIDTYFSAYLGPEISIYKHVKLEMLLQEFSLKPKDCLFITDTVGDIIESQKAGVETVAVTWGYHTKEQLRSCNPTYLINTIEELTSLLK